MPTNVSLLLVYETPGGRLLTVARVDDMGLTRLVALTAISECEGRAAGLATVDATLGAIQRQEAIRLRQVLGMLIPSIANGAKRD